MRAGSGAPLMPGSGTKIKAPPTRASTSRNPYRAPVDSVTLSGIAAEVSEQRDGVTHGPVQHPRQQEKQAGEKGEQARDSAKGVVLHGGGDLHQTDHEARDET